MVTDAQVEKKDSNVVCSLSNFLLIHFFIAMPYFVTKSVQLCSTCSTLLK